MFSRSTGAALPLAASSLLIVCSSPGEAVAQCTPGHPEYGCVDLEFRPSIQSACPGDIVDIGLYAVADGDGDRYVSVIRVLLWWDSTQLNLLYPYDGDNPYEWWHSNFPADENADGLNEDLGDDQYCNEVPCQYDGDCPSECDMIYPACNEEDEACEHQEWWPFNDGDAWYWAWAAGDCFPEEGTYDCAVVPPEGLLVTKLRFELLTAGTAWLAMIPEYGEYSTTRVMSGRHNESGRIITGQLGPPVEVTGCQPPEVVTAEGPRYLSITPTFCTTPTPVALMVSRGSCVKYVQEPNLEGRAELGPLRVELTPEEWVGTGDVVHVYGTEIVPGASYTVSTECEADGPISESKWATTWGWGDVNNAAGVDLEDLLLVLHAFEDIFNDATLENVDLWPCEPDGKIELEDIVSVLDAFRHVPYPCSDPC